MSLLLSSRLFLKSSEKLSELAEVVRSITFLVINRLLLFLLVQVKALGCDGSSSLSSWLENIGLHEYLPNFLASGYRSLDCVKNLWELEIVNVSHGDTPRWWQ